jgi:hypothetical protein
MQAAHFQLRIEEVPAACRYFADASSVGFSAGAVYGLKTLWAAGRLLLHHAGIIQSKKFKSPGTSESDPIKQSTTGRDRHPETSRA